MRVNILTFATPIAKNERFLPEFSRLSSGSSGSTGNGTWMAAPDPPTTRAGGQDDVSYNKLPQIILFRAIQYTNERLVTKSATIDKV